MSQSELQPLIDACEQEPIHIPGGIQPYGAMLAFSPYFSRVLQASANAADFFAVDDIWQASAHSLIDGWVLQQAHEALQFGETLSVEVGGIAYLVYASDSYWVVEAERLAPHHAQTSIRRTLERAIHAFAQQQTPQDLLNELTRQVRRVSGFERVMVYQFDADWHGRVTADATGQRLSSMLGHHFPASDIPAQARAMYSHNPFRIIGSATQNPIPLQAAADTLEQTPVNMSAGALRAVSPIHMQYLQNLGVAASSSIGIFNENKLWGIIACHHIEDIWLNVKTREALVLMVQYASQRFFYLEQAATQGYQRQVHKLRDTMARDDASSQTPQQLFDNHAQGWLDVLNADGCCYIEGTQRVCSMGNLPTQTSCRAITAWLNENVQRQPYWSTRNIVQSTGLTLQSDDRDFAGLMAVPMYLQGEEPAWLLFYRKEEVEVRSWAGKPEKQVYKGATGDMLGPRKSFAMWQQKVEGQSAPWSDETLFAARDLARDLLVVTDSMHLKSLNEKLACANAKLTELAERDDLTGVWNRRYAEQRLKEGLQKAKRYQHPLSVLLLDLDRFKQINDQHGHNVGDQVLQAVCDEVAGLVRETDIFARWGGEEFIVITSDTRANDALGLAERVRQAVANLQVDDLPKVTVSIGVAEFQHDQTWDSIVERADKAMYQAKQQGRDQVVNDGSNSGSKANADSESA